MISISVWTLVSHLILFLLMVVILNQLLFKPMLRIFDLRKGSVDDNQHAAAHARTKADELGRDFASQMEAAKKDALLERDQVKKAAQDEEDKIIKAAREKAGDVVAGIREKIAAEYQSASQSLTAEAQAMGKEIAVRILGRAL